MKPILASSVLLFLLALAGYTQQAHAAQSNSRSERDAFSDFRMIGERNIFNPNRSARSSNQPERRETRRTPRVDYVTLLGTMSYSKGPFAFFEGSRSDYKKVAQPGDKIAQFGVAAIEGNRVMLNAGTNWVELAVGKQLRREDEGEWEVREAPERQITSYTSSSSSSSSNSSSSSRPSSSGSSGSSSSSAPPPAAEPGQDGPPPVLIIDPETGAIAAAVENGMQTNAPPATTSGDSGDPGDVLRRLMERREQEINR